MSRARIGAQLHQRDDEPGVAPQRVGPDRKNHGNRRHEGQQSYKPQDETAEGNRWGRLQLPDQPRDGHDERRQPARNAGADDRVLARSHQLALQPHARQIVVDEVGQLMPQDGICDRVVAQQPRHQADADFDRSLAVAIVGVRKHAEMRPADEPGQVRRTPAGLRPDGGQLGHGRRVLGRT
jgi:hypothetical protein